MKGYPSIPSWSRAGGTPVYVFDKLDGSNVRCEVTRKGVISKFGKRDGLLDEQTPHLIQAATLIPEKYGEDLCRLRRGRRLRWTRGGPGWRGACATLSDGTSRMMR